MAHPIHPRRTVLVVASLTLSLVNFRKELLEALAATGARVVATAPDEDPAAENVLAGMGVEFIRLPFSRASTNPLEDLGYLRAMCRLFRRTRPDVVIPYTAKPVIYAGIAARLTGIGTVFPLMTGLGHVFSDHSGGLRHKAVRAATVRLYRAGLKRSPKLFVYNEADAAEIERLRFVGPDQPLVMVPGSGVNLERFARQPVPEGDLVFLMTTRLLKEKGVFEFIETARRLGNRHEGIRFQLLGPLDPNPSALTREELERIVESGIVEYLGVASDVRPHLARCSVFVLPTAYREGIPRTILEALAVGRAVIASDIAGCRPTVAQGWNGFRVPARDADALAAAAERFIADRTLAVTMGRRSRELAERAFDVHAVNRHLLGHMAAALAR